MYGMDFYQATGDYLPTEMTSLQKRNISAIVKSAWKNNRAVPLVSWHLHSPYAVYSDFNNKMGCRYHHLVDGYPQQHRFIINEILNNKQVDTLGIDKIGDWFDAQVKEIANIINTDFIDENGNPIPFIFRLWHEQEDSWQWWGWGGGESRYHVTIDDYKKFWRLTVEKFRQYCPKAQILWCYCPDRWFEDEETYLKSYPGDDVVDVIAYDDYNIGKDDKYDSQEEYMADCLTRARVITSVSKRLNKPAFIAETNCMRKEMKDVYFDNVERILTDKEVHLCILQLWSMSYYKQETIEFVNLKNIIYNL